jgi:zona occludens toxin (predicted ATPase)
MRLQPVVAVTGNIVRITGQGLVCNHGKTEKALRVVPLPRFVTSMVSSMTSIGSAHDAETETGAPKEVMN